MRQKRFLTVSAVGMLTLLLVAGAAVAAVFPEDNTFTGTVNQFEKGIKIGKQGTGGVTFFNGTIVNQTTTDGTDNPVTFGDNVRIDGRIQRGHNRPGDTWNVQIDDGLEVWKDLEVSGNTTLEGTSTHKGKADFQGGIEWAERTGSVNVSPASYQQIVTVTDVRCSKSNILGLACGTIGTTDAAITSAPINLPSGVRLKSITANLFDEVDTHGVAVYLVATKVNQIVDFVAYAGDPFSFVNGNSIEKIETGKAYKNGYTTVTKNLSEQIDSSAIDHKTYEVIAFFGNEDGSGGDLPTTGTLRVLDVKIDYTYTEPY